jgi:DMSO reductase anchor subunit
MFISIAKFLLEKRYNSYPFNHAKKYSTLLFYLGGLALLLAFVHLFHDRSIFKNILLFVIFLTLGIIHFHVYITSATPGFNSNIASDIFLISKYLLGPSMYILFLAVFRKDFIFYYELFLHLVPVTFAILFVIVDIYGIKNPQGLVSSIRFYLLENSLPEHLLLLALPAFCLLCAMAQVMIYLYVKERKKQQACYNSFTVVGDALCCYCFAYPWYFYRQFFMERLARVL